MKAVKAADLIYPLRLHQNRLDLLLRRCNPERDQARGRLIVSARLALGRAESIAREMTPFDPSGL